MVDFARLVMTVDASGMVPGEQALNQLARTGSRVEGSIKLNTKGIEQSMAALGNAIGGLGGTMKSLEAAVSRSIGSAAQEAQKGARSFDDLRRSIDPAYAASQRFAGIQQELAALVAQGAAKQDQANQVLEMARSRYLGIATAAETAEQAQREQAQTLAAVTGNYGQLRAALDPVYASSQRYEQAIETADAALKAKIITEREHARVLQLAETRYLALTPTIANATGGLARFTPQIQNAGYQVQDFAVQVASGQSAMIAFTQQFPQLAGALGVSGKLALLGVGLGTLVAVGAAVAPMFMGMGSSAKTAEEAVSSLEEVVGRYQTAVSGATMSTDELTAKFGVNAGAARDLYGVMKDLADLEFGQAMANAVSATTGVFSGLAGELQRINQLSKASIGDTTNLSSAFGQLQSAVGDLNDKYGLGYGQLVELNRAMDDLADAKGPSEQARAAAVLVGSLRDAQAAGAEIPPVILQTANELGRASMLGLELTGNSDNAAAALRNAEAAARGLASALAAAAGFSAGIESQIQVIDARIAAQKAGADAAIAGQMTSMRLEARAARDRQIASGMDQFNAEALYQLDLDRIEQLGERTAQERKLAEASRESAKGSRKATSEATKAAKKAATAAKKTADALDKEAQQWRELLDPVAKYKREVSDLTKLSGLLSKSEMAEAQRRLNVELADSLPLTGEFVDTMTDGLLSGFNGTLSSMGDMLKKWLAQAIAMAAKNRIVIGMGLGGMGGVGSAASALGGVPGLGGAGGMLGGIGAGLGAFGGAALTGASGFLSAAAGGLGSAATYTGFMLKGATSGLVGLGSALGAIALPLAGVAAVFSFFSKKTKELDAGMRITVDGFETMVETFRKTETRRFWGLSKKTRTSYDGADRETQDALARAVGDLQEGVMNAAQVLGFGAETFAAFSHIMQISTKGMSEEEAMKAVQEAITGLGDDFAGMVPGLERLTKGGETASAALSRLSQSLVGVNGIMDTLGHKFRAAGLAGADAASQIADAFGSLDAMASATQRFYQAFYSEQERLETTTRQTGKALADLGLAMPRTRNEYRAIIASMDLTTKKGRETYAALIGLADAFDVILPQVASLTAEMAALQGSVQTGLDAAISAAGEAATANARAAADWYKAAGSIREYMDKLRGTASALFSPQQALRYNRNQYQATMTQAKAGDLAATQNVTGVADRYLSSVLATAKTREEAALAQARVLSDLGLLQGSGDIEGARHDVIAGLLGQQIEAMEQYRDILVANGTLTAKQIEELGKKLGGLDEAIAAAELINYQYLKERLNVTVDVIADAKIPAHLKTLLANATNGVEGFVDFIARSDLSADMKWLALTGASEHVKTIAYLARNRMSQGMTALALDTVSTLQKTVDMLVGKRLPADVMRLALAGSSELSRVVNATLSARISPEAKRLALGNVGAYSVNVMASLSPNIGATVRRLVIRQQGSYAAMIEGAISADMSAESRRILLKRQGNYIARISGALAADMGGAKRRLLLNKTTTAARRVTISAVYADGVTEAQRALFNAITGRAAGKVTLGGTFQFNPSKGFATWYETATRTAISNPMNALRDAMGTLRGSLLSLRAAILAEAKRQREAVEKAKETVNKPDPKPKPQPAPAKTYGAADYRGRTVITNNGFAQSDGDRFGREYGYRLTGPLGGTKDFDSQTAANAWLKVNNYPAFATGGTHRGGPAYVGEKDLELVAPSRIYNPSETRAMLDNRETVAELKALRTEIAELRAHARRTADSAVQTEKTLKRVDALGVKIDPDQNKVTA